MRPLLLPWLVHGVLSFVLPPFIGAEESRGTTAIELARFDALIKPGDRQHWAFQPIRRPDVPPVKNLDWPRNPLDAFILAKLEEKGWLPAPPAEPHQLLRRACLDLTGLPPTLAEQDAFATGSSQDAYERLIDRLLATPGYGERWGRHWLDLARYAESNGYERDASKPHAWRYRDYVIQAFNEDRPFNRFAMEQIAGDELDDANGQTLIATGFHRLGPWDDEPADPAEDRYDQIDDMVSTTAQVFLGLTVGCARCHNHKFEPLTMHDYYRLVAVFSPLRRPQNGRTELDLPAASRPEVAMALGYSLSVVGQVSTPPALAFGPMFDQRSSFGALPRGYFLVETGSAAPTTHLLVRGKAARQGPVVEPGVPAVLTSKQPEFLPPSPSSTRRRLSLAHWIVSPQNPLTARVIVNRVWQYHFGEGLVRTASDFGTNGERPTHPELLDWLASWFVEHNWSLKQLHRVIMTSSTYRMSKQWNPAYGAEDPETRLFWRFPYKRLEAEVVRDSMLAVSGQLNRKMFGPSMYPEVPREALEGHSDPDKIWKPLDEREAARRTVYAFIKRSMVVPMLEALDLCDTTRTAARRNTTTVAPQALTLLNGGFVRRQTRHLAARLEREAGDDPALQIAFAFRLGLARLPSPSETTRLLKFLEAEAAAIRQEGKHDLATSRRLALEEMCRIVFNLNEFVYAD